MLTLGIISDTHDLLRPEAVKALQHVDRIIHAGDIGSFELLRELKAIAPTVAVRGNTDRGAWTAVLPFREAVEVEGLRLYVLHDISRLDLDPKAAGFSAVIFGHSHRPQAEMRNGVLFLNPGSAGKRRFTLPVTMAEMTIANGQITYDFKTLVGQKSGLGPGG
jgi:putative phosphoesterase